MSRLIPGGAASGGTASYQMFTATGAPPERVVSGLTATTLISTAVLFSLPVLSLPAILFGGAAVDRDAAARPRLRDDRLRPDPAGRRRRLFTDRPLRAVGTLVAAGAQPPAAPPRAHDAACRTGWSTSAISSRACSAGAGGRRCRTPPATGCSTTARCSRRSPPTGARPRASLVLLAYVVAALLGMVPITPGGLGFVEVGLVATLGLAGVGVADATLAHARLSSRLVLDADPGGRGGLRALPATVRREAAPPAAG